jgi:hypothetical protein
MGDDTCTTLRHIGVELIHIWEMIKILTMHNNDITPRHIGVGLIHWVPPQCALVLYVHNSKTQPLIYIWEMIHAQHQSILGWSSYIYGK